MLLFQSKDRPGGCGVNFNIAKGGDAGGEFAGVGVGSQLGLQEGAVCG